MYFNKTKKGIAVLMSIVMIITTVAVCVGILSANAASDNFLNNASFETADKLWNSATNQSGNPGYVGKDPKEGQNNLVADGWRAVTWGKTGKRATLDHTSDSYNGNYAIKVNIKSGDGDIHISPDKASLQTSAITEGYYTFSAWIKSSNGNAKTVLSAKYKAKAAATAETFTEQIPVGEQWHQVILDDIYLTDGAANLETFEKTSYSLRIDIFPDTVDTYVQIDDVKLTKSDNMLSGGRFETYISGAGYTEKDLKEGQNNLIADGWRAVTWGKAGKRATLDHTNDSHSGSYAIKVNIKSGDGDIHISPDKASLNTDAITEGYYTLSAWVKSTNGNAKTVLSAKYIAEGKTTAETFTKQIPVGEEWHQVSLNIYLTDGAANLSVFENKSYDLRFKIYADTKDTYFQIDNVKLTKLEFLTNPDFENGLSAWSSNNEGTNAKAESSSEASSGEKSVKITLSDENSKLTLNEVSLPKEDFTEGYYMWAFDAKGTASLKATANSSEREAELTEEWQRFVVKDVDLEKGELSSMKLVASGQGEVYIDNIEFYRQVGPGGLIDDMTITQNGDSLKLPVAPEGYKITVLSSSNTDILALDGTFTVPEAETEIEVVLKITNINDATDTAKTDPFKVTVKPVAIDTPEPPTGGDGEDGGHQFLTNYLIGGGLDTADKLWNSATNKEGNTGYTDIDPKKGQNNLVADGWRAITWGETGKRATLDHTTDSHSGSYAVRVNIKNGDGDIHISPDKASLNTDAITEGYYTLSVWVKSTNTKTTTVLSAKYTAEGKTAAETFTEQIPAGEQWHKVSLKNIYLTDGAENLESFQNSCYDLRIKIYADTADSYVIFDDFCLEKQD